MRRILVVDDDLDHRRIFSESLYYNGYDVIEAVTGMAAIDQAREARPDLILMDIRLPDINGLLATEIIKATPGLEHIPVVCLTGMTAVTLAHAMKRGCANLLYKPITPEKLLGAIRMYLEPEAPEAGAV